VSDQRCLFDSAGFTSHIFLNYPVGIRPHRGRIPPGFSFWELEMSFSVKVGRFEIIATSGKKNGSVPVLKSEAEEFDVFERKKAGSAQRAQQGLTFETAVTYCVQRVASAKGEILLH
jgi:hypothetical protein